MEKNITSVLVEKIITHKVLNEETGEFETKDFVERRVSAGIAKGWRMVYTNKYQEVLVKVCNGRVSSLLFVWFSSQFNKTHIDVALKYDDAKKVIDGLSKTQYHLVLQKLIKNNFLKRSSRGVYRLNPYIYLPYGVNNNMVYRLQKEWNELEKQND